jgi:subtilisin family serine protease
MTNNKNKFNSDVTRRTVFKTISGAAVSLAGLGTATAKEKFADREYDSEVSQWVLRLSSVEDSINQKDTVEEIKSQAKSTQQPVVETLQEMEAVSVESQFWIANSILVEGEDYSAKELSKITGVEDVHPNFEVESPEPVDTQEIYLQPQNTQATYGLNQIKVPAVWNEYDTRGDGVRVAVLDTGLDDSHPDIDLAENGWAQFDADGNLLDTQPNDPNGHGTHVSGTISGGNASDLHIGVAPNVTLLNAKVLDGGGTFAQIISGIEWAVDQDTDIINMSLGAKGYYPAFIEPVRNTENIGTLVVSSSGNEGAKTSGSPANVYESFAVGATNSREGITNFSSGERIHTPSAWEEPPSSWPTWYTIPDISAPGNSVLSSVPGGGWERKSGTSMASPHVAGIAALLLSADGNLEGNPKEAKRVLDFTANHPLGNQDTDTRYGKGIANAFNAVTDRTSDGIVTGKVTYNGEPSSSVPVQTQFGTYDYTDKEGNFSIPHPEKKANLQANIFGANAEVETEIEGITDVDIQLSPELDVASNEGSPLQPPDMEVGSTFGIELATANAEELIVSIADETTDIAAENVTLDLDGKSIQLDQPVSLGETGQTFTINVTVQDVPDGAKLALKHEFSGLGESTALTTGPTTILTDPKPATFEIVDPNFQQIVEAGSTLTFTPKIKNTGDLTATKDVTLVIILEPYDPFKFPISLNLGPGNKQQIEVPITIGASFPRQTGEQQIIMDDDEATGTFQFKNSEVSVPDFQLPEMGTSGGEVKVEVPVKNVGELKGTLTLSYYFTEKSVDSTTVEVGANSQTTATLSVDTEGLPPQEYAHKIESYKNGSLTQEFSGTIQLEEPEQHESGVPMDIFNEFLPNGADTSLGTVRDNLSKWQNPPQGEINGVEATLGQIRTLLNWWQQNQ